MTKKDFLKKNKEELSLVISKLNKEEDPEIEDLILDIALKIASNYKFDITIEEIEEILSKIDFKSLNNDDKEIEEQLLKSDIKIDLEVEDDDYEVNNYKQYIKEIRKYPLLTKEQEVELFTRYNNGKKKLKEQIILSNLRLVVSIASRFKYRNYQELLDFIEAGNIGLFEIIDKYDVNLGYKFSTYAVHNIAREIQKYVADNTLHYRLPKDVDLKRKQIDKAKDKLYKLNGRDATPEEIAKETGIRLKVVKFLINALTPATSIYATSANSNGIELQHFIADDSLDNYDQVLMNNLPADLEKAMKAVLSQRDIEILKLRYGFDNKECLTGQEVASMYNITAARVGQIERNAFEKIRKYDANGQLSSYLYK